MSHNTYRTERLPIAHEVDHEGSGRYEEELHQGVVEGDEVHEQVEVAQTEN